MGDDAYEPLGPPPAPPAAEDNYEPLGPPPAKPAEPAAPANEENNNQYEPINFPQAPVDPPKVAKPEKEEKFVQKRLPKPDPAEEDEPTTDLNSQRKSKQSKASKKGGKSGKKGKEDKEKEPTGKSAEKEKADSIKSTVAEGKGKRKQKRSACNIACLVVSGIFAVVFLLIAIGAGVLIWKKDWAEKIL